MLVKKWKKAAKKSKKTRSILKKTAAKGKKGGKRVDNSNFDPMSVLGKKPVNNKSKLSDLILYIVAKNQVAI
jgi:hypothetical protein